MPRSQALAETPAPTGLKILTYASASGRRVKQTSCARSGGRVVWPRPACRCCGDVVEARRRSAARRNASTLARICAERPGRPSRFEADTYGIPC